MHSKILDLVYNKLGGITMPKVSIIVPVYNAEKYLSKCLDSLVNQTLKDIEIIVINDGSSDKSQYIIDEFQKKYSNLIRSYIKENRWSRHSKKLWNGLCKRKIYKFC